MYNLKLIVTLVMLCFSLRANGSFPDDPTPCQYGDVECLTKSIKYFLSEKSQGDDSINLNKIDPLEIKTVSINQGVDSPVNIDLTFTNCSMYGLSKADVIKVKGFDKDMDQTHEFILRTERLDIVGDYVVKGKILILPISGTGKSNISMINVDLAIKFSGIPVEKDGSTYLKINKLQLKTEPKRIIFRFDNLFNGDKALGDNMNLFLNENWSDIFAESRDSFHSAFGRIYKSVISKVFTKYPYDKFFKE